MARPAGEKRLCLKRADLSPDNGLIGDRWRATSWLKRSDGSPDPAVQITLMNSRCIKLIAGDESYWPLAGDNLFVDFDLSAENLPVGTRLRIGECLLEISEPPHTGYAKFNRRFGAAALKFVNSAEGKCCGCVACMPRLSRAESWQSAISSKPSRQSRSLDASQCRG